MRIIGITGKTGAGKTAVCEKLCEHGFFHLDADKVAKEVLAESPSVIKKLYAEFGDGILNGDGTLNSKKLSAAAFRTKKTAERLDDIVYPAVVKEIKKIVKEKSAENFSGIIIDAIGLFESGADKLCDFTVTVTADEKTRLKRITARDALSKEDALKRIRAQKDDGFFAERSDLVLENNGKNDLDTLVKKVLNYE